MRAAILAATLAAGAVLSPALQSAAPGGTFEPAGSRGAERWSEEGSRLFLEGQAAGAAEAYARAAEADPRNPDAHCRLGAALEAAGDAARAEAAYRRSLALDASHCDTRLSLAELLASLGRGSEARAQVLQATLLRPKDASVQFHEGLARLAEGRAEDAAGSFRRALELNPRHADAQAGLGRALESFGRTAQSKAALESARADLGDEGLQRFDDQLGVWKQALQGGVQLTRKSGQTLRVQEGGGRPAVKASIGDSLGGIAAQTRPETLPPPF